MTLKWGSTVVTAVKWGSTVCTQVKWGSTIVWPDTAFAMMTDFYTGFHGTASSGNSYLGFFGEHSGNSSTKGTVRDANAGEDVTRAINAMATVSNNGTSITMIAKSDGSAGGAHGTYVAITNSPITLTGKTKCTITYTMSGQTIIHLCYASSNSVTYTNNKTSGSGFNWGSQLAYKTNASSSSSTTIDLTFSGKTGNYYLGFNESNGSNTASFNHTITAMTVS